MLDALGIESRTLTESEKEEYAKILATGNQIIKRVLSLPGMHPSRRNLYRRIILCGLTTHPDCTPQELTNCRVSPEEVAAVRRIEDIKMPLLEGYVRLLNRIVQRATNQAVRFTREQSSTLRKDLRAEAFEAFCEAVYRHVRPEGKFVSYMSVLVRNRLNEYCERIQIVKPGETLLRRLRLYYAIRHELIRQSGMEPTFDAIFHEMVVQSLAEEGKKVTDDKVAARLSRWRKIAQHLRQALSDVSATPLEYTPDSFAFTVADFEVAVAELCEGLTPLQTLAVRNRAEGHDEDELAKRAGVTAKQARAAFRQAKKIIGRRELLAQ
jgi:hypothetical protein